MRDQRGKNTTLRPPCNRRGFIVGVFFLNLSAALYSQQTPGPMANETDLPDAPGREALSMQSLDAQSAASISGIVLDVNDGLVPDAKIILETQNGQVERVTEADSSGVFSFKNFSRSFIRAKTSLLGRCQFSAEKA